LVARVVGSFRLSTPEIWTLEGGCATLTSAVPCVELGSLGIGGSLGVTRARTSGGAVTGALAFPRRGCRRAPPLSNV
jgi:hypothetical protein